MNQKRGRPAYTDILTPAEWRVVNAVRHGLKNREIAALENISIDGVKYHVANAIAKIGLDNKKSLMQWDGIPADSSINQGDPFMQESNEIQAMTLGQVARSVRNISASEQWYKEVLGLRHLYTFDKLAFFDLGDTRLMLSEADPINTSESLLYIRVKAIHETYMSWQQKGIHFVNAPHMIHKHEDGTEEWMAFFEDLEKRPLGLMSSVKS